MALPEDHLAKFHKMTDAKEMWDAIKSRFGGNDESKKMQKYILKQQFEGFSVSNTEGLHKGYDRFQSLLSQLEIHGACVSIEDANQKFLRSLPSAWSQVSLIMRTKPGIDEYDLQEMDLKWQVAMILMRMKKFYKKTGRKLQFDAKEPVGFDKTKVECYNCHKTDHFVRECRIKGTQENKRRDAWNSGNKDGSRTGQKEDSKALVTVDGESRRCGLSNHSRRNEDMLLMACNSSYSDTENVNPKGPVSECSPIIEEYESNSDDECVVIPTKQQETPSFANQQVKTPRENVKSQYTQSQKPKVDKKDLGHGFLLKEHGFYFNGGPVAFGGSKGYITGKGKIKTGKLDFEDVCFVKELQHFNLFSVSQMCDKKNKGSEEYRMARTPSNKMEMLKKEQDLIEAARTMLADSLFTITAFWAEAVSTRYFYVLNEPLTTLASFAGKSMKGFLVGYSLQSKAFRVYNLETKRVEENMHITFLENKPNVAGKGPNWLFDLDYLTDSMNYHPVSSENQANHAGQQEANQNAGTTEIIDAGDSDKE
ncbi:ribonuclease H-like domain-containing protein [Tanacetum coccineum]